MAVERRIGPQPVEAIEHDRPEQWTRRKEEGLVPEGEWHPDIDKAKLHHKDPCLRVRGGDGGSHVVTHSSVTQVCPSIHPYRKRGRRERRKSNSVCPQVALNWLLQRPMVASVIIGARDEDQLRDNLGAVGWRLTTAQVARLEDASATTPIYPYHQWQFKERNPTPWGERASPEAGSPAATGSATQGRGRARCWKDKDWRGRRVSGRPLVVDAVLDHDCSLGEPRHPGWAIMKTRTLVLLVPLLRAAVLPP